MWFHEEFLKNMMKIGMSSVPGRVFFEMENPYWLVLNGGIVF